MKELDDETLSFRLIDVLEELDYAVALGVVCMPAVAIDGKLTFSGLPADGILRERLQECRSTKVLPT